MKPIKSFFFICLKTSKDYFPRYCYFIHFWNEFEIDLQKNYVRDYTLLNI